MPLILWGASGRCARFCQACAQRWWGLISFDDPPLDDPDLP